LQHTPPLHSPDAHSPGLLQAIPSGLMQAPSWFGKQQRPYWQAPVEQFASTLQLLPLGFRHMPAWVQMKPATPSQSLSWEQPVLQLAPMQR